MNLEAPAGARLVLARHGQTIANVHHVLDTLPPGPGLTELGTRQALTLAERLGEEKIAAIHASRARRAQETAAPLARRLGLPVEIAEGTHEIGAGDYEGRGDPEAMGVFEDVYRRWQLGELDVRMPGAQTGREVLTRFLDSARSTLDGVSGGAIVLVSHGAMLRMVGQHLAANVTGEMADAVHLPNTGLIVLDADPDAATGWTCTTWDGLDL
ncbi:histidine phosphatase family protein [Saccharopolyspora sp. CA-218241]|uniref:histidine phosphatase family protein n=1 Tax=Saccharopolyspora sp. CA-218241 TaxID=3240027 RepID=UPI003D959D98